MVTDTGYIVQQGVFNDLPLEDDMAPSITISTRHIKNYVLVDLNVTRTKGKHTFTPDQSTRLNKFWKSKLIGIARDYDYKSTVARYVDAIFD